VFTSYNHGHGFTGPKLSIALSYIACNWWGFLCCFNFISSISLAASMDPILYRNFQVRINHVRAASSPYPPHWCIDDNSTFGFVNHPCARPMIASYSASPGVEPLQKHISTLAQQSAKQIMPIVHHERWKMFFFAMLPMSCVICFCTTKERILMFLYWWMLG
jgi:hypothetical protein